MEDALVSIIIANYNGAQHLPTCLESVRNSNYSNWECILVDDGSTDNSLSIIKSYINKDRRFRLYTNSQNLGAAASRNNALVHANGEIVIFLDNDTQVDSQWIPPLLDALSDNSVGGAQSTLVDYNDRTLIQLSGVLLQPHTAWGIPLQKNEPISSLAQDTRDIIALSAALAVRKRVIEQTGGFDEKLAVYTEDLEFSLRIWIAGYRIVSCPASIVYHWTKKIEDRRNMHVTKEQIYFHLAKNTLRTIIKNYQLPSLVKYLPASLAILVIRAFIILLKQMKLSCARGTTKGILWNIVNLLDTLSARKLVQSKIRKSNDSDFAQKVFCKESLLSVYKNYYR